MSVEIERNRHTLVVSRVFGDLEPWQAANEGFRINCGVDACECLVGVNNREPWWSEITPSDTLTLGGQAPRIEMSAVSMAVWHTLTWYPEHSATLWGYKGAQHPGDSVTGDRRCGGGALYRNW